MWRWVVAVKSPVGAYWRKMFSASSRRSATSPSAVWMTRCPSLREEESGSSLKMVQRGRWVRVWEKSSLWGGPGGGERGGGGGGVVVGPSMTKESGARGEGRKWRRSRDSWRAELKP